MDEEQKHQTVHMLPRGKATAKFREQHAKATEASASLQAGKKPAANANGLSVSVEKRLNAVLADRLKGITNPKLRKAIEENVREEALKKLAQIMPEEVARAVDSSIAEINKSVGIVVPGKTPVSRPAPVSPSPARTPSSPGYGGKSSSRSYGGK